MGELASCPRIGPAEPLAAARAEDGAHLESMHFVWIPYNVVAAFPRLPARGEADLSERRTREAGDLGPGTYFVRRRARGVNLSPRRVVIQAPASRPAPEGGPPPDWRKPGLEAAQLERPRGPETREPAPPSGEAGSRTAVS